MRRSRANNSVSRAQDLILCFNCKRQKYQRVREMVQLSVCLRTSVRMGTLGLCRGSYIKQVVIVAAGSGGLVTIVFISKASGFFSIHR